MGVKISNLPAIVTPALSDIFPVVQSGITYKETFTQLTSLFATAGANSNITSMTGLSSISFTPTTGGIVGTATNDDASAGYVGQITESTVQIGSAVSLVTTVAKTVTSISLTAGDYDAWGVVGFNAAATTSITDLTSCISLTTNTLTPPPIKGGIMRVKAPFTVGTISQFFPTGTVRISLAATTTVYLVAQGEFTVDTLSAYGYIGARRVR